MSRLEQQSVKPTASVALSLIAGIFILLGGLLWFWMVNIGFWAMQPMMAGMMGFRPSQAALFPLFVPFATLGIVAGVVVILSALMLYRRPRENTLWGTLILVFSALSILGAMGGFLVGFILGVIGGALALASL